MADGLLAVLMVMIMAITDAGRLLHVSQLPYDISTLKDIRLGARLIYISTTSMRLVVTVTDLVPVAASVNCRLRGSAKLTASKLEA